MPNRLLSLTLGTSLLLAAPALAQVDTFPLAPFRAGPVPVMLRVTAPPVANSVFDVNAGDFSLADLSTEEPELSDTAADSQVQSRAPRPVAPGTPKAITRDAGKGLGGGGETEEVPPTPGSFSRSSIRIPSPFLKSQTVAPHTPDVSVDLDKSTSVGLFGELNRTSRTDVEANLAKPERDVGAGFTLQYKFGTH